MKSSFDDGKPIETRDDDILGRKAFSNRLADSIINWSGNSLVLGVCGDWGSGKTSLINMALEKIGESHEEYQPVTVKFNPWLFSNRNQIIKKFFDSLILEIKDNDISDKLKSYAEKLIPGILTISGILAPGSTQTLLDISKYVEERKTEEESLELLKDKINELIIQNGKQILIIIDDIDRLENGEIQLIFQLVNKLADFSNTVYLLAFDKKVVIDALEDQSFDGLEYLKKIVQIFIDVPAISKVELKYLYFYHLEQIVDISKDVRKRLDGTFDNFFRYYLKNIRDIQRYMNNVRFTYDLVKRDVNLYDFLVVTAIQVFSPDLYINIYKNKEIFIYTNDPFQYLQDYRVKERDKFNEIIKNEKSISNETALKSSLTTIFPKIQHLDEKYDKRPYNDTIPILKLTKRIQFEEHFETYFKFGVPNWELSQIEFEAVLNSVEERTIFHDNFNNLNDHKKIKFLETLEFNLKNQGIDIESFKRDISENELKKLFEYYILESFKLNSHVMEKMELLAEEYIKKYDQKFQSAKKIIQKAENPFPICSLIENLYGDDSFDKKTLDDIKRVCAEKIKVYLEKEGFKNLEYPFFVLRYWKEGGNEEEMNDFMLKIDDSNLMILINYSAQIHPPRNILESLNEVFDLDNLKNRLNGLLSKKGLSEIDITNIKKIQKVITDT